jgi:Ca2+-binding RTX toxin-like protein
MARLTARLGIVTCVLVAATAGAGTPASADTSATVFDSGGTYNFEDAEGVHDLRLTVSSSGSTIVFDADSTIVPGHGCRRPDVADPTVAHCLHDIGSGPLALFVSADGGDDHVELNLGFPGPVSHSTLLGGDGDDVLIGGDGSDTMFGGSGADEMFGRGGDDNFAYSLGPDLMAGGPGVDLVDYAVSSLTDGVRASADGIVGDDGPLGEGDTIGGDVENLRGTPYGDVLVGNSLPNRIQGCQGADRLFGGSGNDTFLAAEPGSCSTLGTRSADHIDGGAGLDTVDYFGHGARVWADLDDVVGDDGASGEGDSIVGAENLVGTEFNDVLIGNATSNVISGGRGDDLIIGNNGVNTLNGNEGDDVLHGGADSDVLNGGNGADDLFGGAGFDWCDLGFDGRVKYHCEL